MHSQKKFKSKVIAIALADFITFISIMSLYLKTQGTYVMPKDGWALVSLFCFILFPDNYILSVFSKTVSIIRNCRKLECFDRIAVFLSTVTSTSNQSNPSAYYFHDRKHLLIFDPRFQLQCKIRNSIFAASDIKRK